MLSVARVAGSPTSAAAPWSKSTLCRRSAAAAAAPQQPFHFLPLPQGQPLLRAGFLPTTGADGPTSTPFLGRALPLAPVLALPDGVPLVLPMSAPGVCWLLLLSAGASAASALSLD